MKTKRKTGENFDGSSSVEETLENDLNQIKEQAPQSCKENKRVSRSELSII